MDDPLRPTQVASTLSVLALRAAEQDVLVVVGEADLATVSALREGLLLAVARARNPIAVELGALSFCGLVGLDALQDAARAADAAGVELTFRGMSAHLAWMHRTFPAVPVRARRCRRSNPYLGGDPAPRGAP